MAARNNHNSLNLQAALRTIAAVVFVGLLTIAFLYWQLTRGIIGHWSAPTIIISACINVSIVLFFCITQYRKAHASRQD